MGINDLELTPELIAALYPDSLLAAKESDLPLEAGKTDMLARSAVPAYPFMGKNLRSVCFLVNYPNDDFVPEDQQIFISKMLGACKYSLDDIALINTAYHAVEISALKKQLHPTVIFLWGAVSATIGDLHKFPDMEVSLFEDTLVVPVLSADLMTSDVAKGLELKQKLWGLLKKLFKL